MEFFEEMALKSAPSRPRFWRWYGDDTCCIMKREPSHHQVHRGAGEGCFFSFLDTQREDRTLSLTVFRKQTQVPGTSTPNTKCKEGCHQESLLARNVMLQKEDMWKEEEHLTATFKQNGSIQEPQEVELRDEKSHKEEPLVVIPVVRQIRKACAWRLTSNRAQSSAHCPPEWRTLAQGETGRCGLPDPLPVW